MRIAWLLVGVAAACGNVSVTPGQDAGGQTPDGSLTDDGGGGAVDAGSPDAWVQGPIEVTVKKLGVVQPDVEVLFSEADGTAVARLLTNASGYTRADLYPGGIVSVLWTDAEGKHAAAFYDLRGGDHIVYDMDGSAPTTPDVGDVIIDFNTANKPATATKWDVHIGCSHFELAAAPNSYTETIDSDCVGAGSKVNVLVRAYNGTAFLAYGTAMDLNQVSGDWTAPIVWQVGAPANVNVALTGGPAHSTMLMGEVIVERNGIRYGLGNLSGPAGAGSSMNMSWPVPAGFAQTTGVQVGVVWDMSAGPEGMSFYTYRSATAIPDPFSRDLSATLLPRVNNVTVEHATPGRPTVTWQADAALAADVLMVDLHQEGTIAADDDRRWRLFLPPDFVPPVRLPLYSTDVSEYAPDASAFEDPDLIVFEIPGADGYRSTDILFGTAVQDPSGANAQEMKFEFIGDK